MKYADEERGKIQNPNRKKQLFDFSRLKYGKITGSDIDMFWEYHNEVFLFYEFKYWVTNGIESKLDMPRGQKVAYMRLIDAVQAGGKEAVLFSCHHTEADTSAAVDAAECVVDKYYYDKKWYTVGDKNALEMTDSFMNYAVKRKGA